jgi:hypothetical protein
MIKDHADDHHSNFDAMDVDPVPETSDSTNFVANGAEDSTNKCDPPQNPVSTVAFFRAVFTFFVFSFGEIPDLRDF